MSQPEPPPPEFHRPIPLDRIGPAWQHHRIAPDAAEARALALRFDLVALDDFTALVKLRRVRGGHFIAFEATLSARVTQNCVVTLDPVENRVEETVSLIFGPIGDPRGDALAREIEVDPDEDAPEPLDGVAIDIGEITAQHLALALDPFPRGPGADAFAQAHGVVATDDDAFAALEPESDSEPARPNPFLVLRDGAPPSAKDRRKRS